MAGRGSSRRLGASILGVAILATSALLLSGGSAQGLHTSQVTAVAARAYALSASVPPLLSIPAVPNPPVEAPPCPTDAGDVFNGVGVNLSPTLDVGAVSARVDCPALPAPLPLADPLAQADVANVTLLAGVAGLTPDFLYLEAVHAECSAGPTGPFGSSSLAVLDVNGEPLGVNITNPGANTVLSIPLPAGLGLPNINVVLNEQFMSGATLVVNAVHIFTDGPILGLVGPIDIVLAHVECAQAVEQVPDTTAPPTTSGPTTAPPTTGPPTTPPTTGPNPTTPPSTGPTVPPSLPNVPTVPPSLPLVPTSAAVLPFVAQTVTLPGGGALARTGFDGLELLVLAFGVTGVGILARRGAQPVAEGSSVRGRIFGPRPKRW